jgi:small subunit ribosomal protein S20
MANIKSQKKRNIQNEKRRTRNVAAKSTLRTSTKKVHAAVAAGDAEAATAGQREAARALDKAASKGVLHKRTAARRKSRLAKAVATPSAEGVLRRDRRDQHRHDDVAGRSRFQRKVGLDDPRVDAHEFVEREVARLLLIAARLPLEA